MKTAIVMAAMLGFTQCAQTGERASTYIPGVAGLTQWQGSTLDCPILDPIIERVPPDHHGYGPSSIASLPGRYAFSACAMVVKEGNEAWGSDAPRIMTDLGEAKKILDGSGEPAALDYLAETYTGYCYLADALIGCRDYGWPLQPVLDGCMDGLTG